MFLKCCCFFFGKTSSFFPFFRHESFLKEINKKNTLFWRTQCNAPVKIFIENILSSIWKFHCTPSFLIMSLCRNHVYVIAAWLCRVEIIMVKSNIKIMTLVKILSETSYFSVFCYFSCYFFLCFVFEFHPKIIFPWTIDLWGCMEAWRDRRGKYKSNIYFFYWLLIVLIGNW